MIGNPCEEEKSGGQTVCDTAQKSDDSCCDGSDFVIHSTDKGDIPDWTFTELAEHARKNRCDMVELLKGRISITEIAV